MKEILTPDQLCEYINIKKSTLYARVEAREIPFYRLGRLLRFRKAEIDAWMERFKVEPQDLRVRAKEIARSIQETERGPSLPSEKPLALAEECGIYSFSRETGPKNQGPQEGG